MQGRSSLITLSCPVFSAAPGSGQEHQAWGGAAPAKSGSEAGLEEYNGPRLKLGIGAGEPPASGLNC